MRNAHATGTGYTADLARKTERLVRESAGQYGLGRTIRTVTFDPDTLAALRSEAGANEDKVFNPVRGLNREIDENAELAPVLRTLQERAERALEGMQSRNLRGLAALEALGVLAEEKREAVRAAAGGRLSARAFAVSWAFRDDEALRSESRRTVRGADERSRARPETARHRQTGEPHVRPNPIGSRHPGPGRGLARPAESATSRSTRRSDVPGARSRAPTRDGAAPRLLVDRPCALSRTGEGDGHGHDAPAKDLGERQPFGLRRSGELVVVEHGGGIDPARAQGVSQSSSAPVAGPVEYGVRRFGLTDGDPDHGRVEAARRRTGGGQHDVRGDPYR